MELVKNNAEFLSYEEVCAMAVKRLENEFEDFNTYRGTEIFSRLLGIYNAKKDEKVTNSDVFNKHMRDYALAIAGGIAPEVVKMLINFCKQNVAFANLVLRNHGSFTSCLAYTIHGFVSKNEKEKKNSAHLSDAKTYQRAVEYYCTDGNVRVVMEVELPDMAFTPITKADVAIITENYEHNKELASAEIEAKERAAAELKAKREAEQKAREEKERKKKEREAKKKAEEEARKKFKEAQASFIPLDEEDDVAVSVPAKKKSTPTNSAFVSKDDTKEESKGNIIQNIAPTCLG